MLKGFFASSVVQKAAPPTLIPRCGQCGLFKGCNSPKMEPYGDGRKGVLVVGEAPGATEDEEGRPFVGKAGKVLRDALNRIGVSLDKDALTTNALICRPPNNKTPEHKQILYCRPNILKTLREYQPTVVVTLGRSALQAVLEGIWTEDIGTMERWVGWKMPLKDFWLCPTYHPSFIMRENNKLTDRLFSDHLEQAFDITDPPPKQPDYESKVEILYDDHVVFEAIKDMDQQDNVVVVDYETNCVKPDWPKAQIYSCALSCDARTISFPWTKTAAEATGQLLNSKRTRKVAHNLKFEERWTLKEFGHGVRGWLWDTMLAAHCLDNRTGICSLKFQSLVRLGAESYNAHIEPYLSRSEGPYNVIKEEISKDQLLLYGGLDGIYERELFKLQREDMGYND